jgi:hypothetical protein
MDSVENIASNSWKLGSVSWDPLGKYHIYLVETLGKYQLYLVETVGKYHLYSMETVLK